MRRSSRRRGGYGRGQPPPGVENLQPGAMPRPGTLPRGRSVRRRGRPRSSMPYRGAQRLSSIDLRGPAEQPEYNSLTTRSMSMTKLRSPTRSEDVGETATYPVRAPTPKKSIWKIFKGNQSKNRSLEEEHQNSFVTNGKSDHSGSGSGESDDSSPKETGNLKKKNARINGISTVETAKEDSEGNQNEDIEQTLTKKSSLKRNESEHVRISKTSLKLEGQEINGSKEKSEAMRTEEPKKRKEKKERKSKPNEIDNIPVVINEAPSIAQDNRKDDKIPDRITDSSRETTIDADRKSNSQKKKKRSSRERKKVEEEMKQVDDVHEKEKITVKGNIKGVDKFESQEEMIKRGIDPSKQNNLILSNNEEEVPSTSGLQSVNKVEQDLISTKKSKRKKETNSPKVLVGSMKHDPTTHSASNVSSIESYVPITPNVRSNSRGRTFGKDDPRSRSRSSSRSERRRISEGSDQRPLYRHRTIPLAVLNNAVNEPWQEAMKRKSQEFKSKEDLNSSDTSDKREVEIANKQKVQLHDNSQKVARDDTTDDEEVTKIGELPAGQKIRRRRSLRESKRLSTDQTNVVWKENSSVSSGKIKTEKQSNSKSNISSDDGERIKPQEIRTAKNQYKAENSSSEDEEISRPRSSSYRMATHDLSDFNVENDNQKKIKPTKDSGAIPKSSRSRKNRESDLRINALKNNSLQRIEKTKEFQQPTDFKDRNKMTEQNKSSVSKVEHEPQEEKDPPSMKNNTETLDVPKFKENIKRRKDREILAKRLSKEDSLDSAESTKDVHISPEIQKDYSPTTAVSGIIPQIVLQRKISETSHSSGEEKLPREKSRTAMNMKDSNKNFLEERIPKDLKQAKENIEDAISAPNSIFSTKENHSPKTSVNKERQSETMTHSRPAMLKSKSLPRENSIGSNGSISDLDQEVKTVREINIDQKIEENTMKKLINDELTTPGDRFIDPPYLRYGDRRSMSRQRSNTSHQGIANVQSWDYRPGLGQRGNGQPRPHHFRGRGGNIRGRAHNGQSTMQHSVRGRGSTRRGRKFGRSNSLPGGQAKGINNIVHTNDIPDVHVQDNSASEDESEEICVKKKKKSFIQKLKAFFGIYSRGSDSSSEEESSMENSSDETTSEDGKLEKSETETDDTDSEPDSDLDAKNSSQRRSQSAHDLRKRQSTSSLSGKLKEVKAPSQLELDIFRTVLSVTGSLRVKKNERSGSISSLDESKFSENRTIKDHESNSDDSKTEEEECDDSKDSDNNLRLDRSQKTNQKEGKTNKQKIQSKSSNDEALEIESQSETDSEEEKSSTEETSEDESEEQDRHKKSKKKFGSFKNLMSKFKSKKKYSSSETSYDSDEYSEDTSGSEITDSATEESEYEEHVQRNKSSRKDTNSEKITVDSKLKSSLNQVQTSIPFNRTNYSSDETSDDVNATRQHGSNRTDNKLVLTSINPDSRELEETEVDKFQAFQFKRSHQLQIYPDSETSDDEMFPNMDSHESHSRGNNWNARNQLLEAEIHRDASEHRSKYDSEEDELNKNDFSEEIQRQLQTGEHVSEYHSHSDSESEIELENHPLKRLSKPNWNLHENDDSEDYELLCMKHDFSSSQHHGKQIIEYRPNERQFDIKISLSQNIAHLPKQRAILHRSNRPSFNEDKDLVDQEINAPSYYHDVPDEQMDYVATQIYHRSSTGYDGADETLHGFPNNSVSPKLSHLDMTRHSYQYSHTENRDHQQHMKHVGKTFSSYEQCTKYSTENPLMPAIADRLEHIHYHQQAQEDHNQSIVNRESPSQILSYDKILPSEIKDDEKNGHQENLPTDYTEKQTLNKIGEIQDSYGYFDINDQPMQNRATSPISRRKGSIDHPRAVFKRMESTGFEYLQKSQTSPKNPTNYPDINTELQKGDDFERQPGYISPAAVSSSNLPEDYGQMQRIGKTPALRTVDQAGECKEFSRESEQNSLKKLNSINREGQQQEKYEVNVQIQRARQSYTDDNEQKIEERSLGQLECEALQETIKQNIKEPVNTSPVNTIVTSKSKGVPLSQKLPENIALPNPLDNGLVVYKIIEDLSGSENEAHKVGKDKRRTLIGRRTSSIRNEDNSLDRRSRSSSRLILLPARRVSRSNSNSRSRSAERLSKNLLSSTSSFGSYGNIAPSASLPRRDQPGEMKLLVPESFTQTLMNKEEPCVKFKNESAHLTKKDVTNEMQTKYNFGPHFSNSTKIVGATIKQKPLSPKASNASQPQKVFENPTVITQLSPKMTSIPVNTTFSVTIPKSRSPSPRRHEIEQVMPQLSEKNDPKLKTSVSTTSSTQISKIAINVSEEKVTNSKGRLLKPAVTIFKVTGQQETKEHKPLERRSSVTITPVIKQQNNSNSSPKQQISSRVTITPVSTPKMHCKFSPTEQERSLKEAQVSSESMILSEEQKNNILKEKNITSPVAEEQRNISKTMTAESFKGTELQNERKIMKDSYKETEECQEIEGKIQPLTDISSKRTSEAHEYQDRISETSTGKLTDNNPITSGSLVLSKSQKNIPQSTPLSLNSSGTTSLPPTLLSSQSSASYTPRYAPSYKRYVTPMPYSNKSSLHSSVPGTRSSSLSSTLLSKHFANLPTRQSNESLTITPESKSSDQNLGKSQTSTASSNAPPVLSNQRHSSSSSSSSPPPTPPLSPSHFSSKVKEKALSTTSPSNQNSSLSSNFESNHPDTSTARSSASFDKVLIHPISKAITSTSITSVIPTTVSIKKHIPEKVNISPQPSSLPTIREISPMARQKRVKPKVPPPPPPEPNSPSPPPLPATSPPPLSSAGIEILQ